MTSTTLLVDATFRLHLGDVDDFRSLACRMAEAGQKRDGCDFLKVTQDIANPSIFRFFEGWRDRKALDAHLESAAFHKVMQDAAKLRIIERSADTYLVAGRSPLQTSY